MDSYLYVVTTRDKFEAIDIRNAFRKYTNGFKWNSWVRGFNDPEKPDEQDARYYWEFKALVTKDQEQKLRKAVKDCKFPTRRRLVV